MMKHLRPLLCQGKKISVTFKLLNFTSYMYTVKTLHKAFLDMESFT